MSDGAIVDTGFLISLVDRNRPCHDSAKQYYRYFLENGVTMFLPTIVAAEFAVKQPVTDLPLRNFRVLPFNLGDATCCAELNVSYYRNKHGAGQRDAVKDDFKIIAQAVEQDARVLLTEDDETLAVYCGHLRKDGKIAFRVVSLQKGFDVASVNEDGQSEMPLES
jgi:hypothetical protein